MEWIEIREDAARPGGAMLRIDGFDHPVTVTSPLDPDQLKQLDWYFEAYLHSPFTGEVPTKEAAASITAYGEALFGQLMASPDAREAYGALKTRAYPNRFAIAIIGAPAFQELHWEALKDPRLPRPFALDVAMVRRRRAAAPPIEAAPATSPTLNLLVLTARPGGSQDVGYRTITRPLVSTLRQAKLRVDVDFVRPGTWRALVERLEAATRDHGAGYADRSDHRVVDRHRQDAAVCGARRLSAAPEAADLRPGRHPGHLRLAGGQTCDAGQDLHRHPHQ
jgi:hypothetical protein